ncbi:Nad-binding phosphogluconate dehydrogenase-like protein [Favolaschia claudopus]|uniref:Nad-binding phosphogluconate dehydrogenase-like protein n=1 Tax=Favolaschia claudopus TaxID=2862362 RepID=A0AAW0CS98_9AGAR
MGSISAPTLAVLAPGAMGAAIAARLSASGAGTILTNLDGRSESTIHRAHTSNMQHASYEDIVQRASYIFSIVPPQEALTLAETIVSAYKSSGSQRPLIFIDCNAVNPESMKGMKTLLEGTGITLLDGVIIGTPPSDSFNPGIYVSADPKDMAALDDFTRMANGLGLNVIPLKGEGAGIGDASAVKMAHSGIVKGTIGLFTTMILAANAASPSTAEGLAHALNLSQPTLADLLIRFVPMSIPKAYRFVAEMEEVSSFTGGDGAEIFDRLSKIFGRVANDRGDIADTLLKFVEQAKEVRERRDAV